MSQFISSSLRNITGYIRDDTIVELGSTFL